MLKYCLILCMSLIAATLMYHGIDGWGWMVFLTFMTMITV